MDADTHTPDTEYRRILLVEDDLAHAEAIYRAFEGAQPRVCIEVARTLEEFQMRPREMTPDLVFMDLCLPDGETLAFLSTRELPLGFPVVVMTSYGDERTAVRLIKAGVIDYFAKTPQSIAAMPKIAERALREWHLLREQENALSALRESEASYRSLVENIPGVVYRCEVKAPWTMLHISEAVLNLTGIPSVAFNDEFKAWASLMLEEDVAMVEQAVAQAVEERRPWEVDYRIRHANGVVCWVHEKGRAIYSGDGHPIYLDGVIFDITMPKQAAEALRTSREEMKRYLDVVESMILVLNKQSRVLLINRKGCDILGYKQEDILGKNWFEHFIPLRFRLDMQERCRDMMTERVAMPAYVENEVLTRRGEERLLAWHNTLLRDTDGAVQGIISACEDITERRIMERSLKEREEHFRGYFELGLIGMAITSISHKWLQVNDRLCEILGYSWEELTTMTWVEMAHPDDVEDGLAQFSDMLGGKIEQCKMEKRFLRKDGQVVNTEVSARCVRRADGSANYFLVMVYDITTRKKAEQESRTHQEQLLRADKMVSLGTLVSGVAHEINNPNAFISVNIDVLRSVWDGIRPILEGYYRENGDFVVAGWNYPELQDRVSGLLSGIADGAGRIKTIVEDLRDFVRSEPLSNLGGLPLNEAVQAAVNLMKNMLNKSTGKFNLTLAGNLPAVYGNRQRLEQVVINLLQNACQALTNHDQGIHVYTEYLPKTGIVRVVVADEGGGIPAELLPRLMDPFFTTRELSGGMGLGLAISGKIVEELQGVLRFESEVGKGTSAFIELPARL